MENKKMGTNPLPKSKSPGLPGSLIKKLKINVTYNIGSKPHEKICTSYCEFGRWIWKNFNNIKMVNIKVTEE